MFNMMRSLLLLSLVFAIALLLTPGLAAAQQEDPDPGAGVDGFGDYACVVNVAGGWHTCGGPVWVNQIGGNKATAEVNVASYQTLIVRVETCNESGWTVHIGDSPTNNGGGGDAHSTSHDAEVQMLNRVLSTFKSDHNSGEQCRSLVTASGCFVVQQYVVQNDFVQYDPFVHSFGDFVTNCPHWALHDFPPYDEPDWQDGGAYANTMYVGLNRTYGDATRSGSGVTRACIFLSPSATPNAGDVNSYCGF